MSRDKGNEGKDKSGEKTVCTDTRDSEVPYYVYSILTGRVKE